LQLIKVVEKHSGGSQLPGAQYGMHSSGIVCAQSLMLKKIQFGEMRMTEE
jgi:hypothetical protein